MITLVLVAQDPPEADWLGRFVARHVGAREVASGAIDEDLLGLLESMRGVSATNRKWIGSAEWHAEVEIDLVDERLDDLQAHLTGDAMSSGMAVAVIRDRTITFPPGLEELDLDEDDPGPIWEHLPIEDPSTPRSDVSLSDAFAVAEVLDRVAEESDGQADPAPSRLSAALAMPRPPYIVLALVVAITAVPSYALFEVADALRFDGMFGDVPFDVVTGAVGTMMNGVALAVAMLIVDRRRPAMSLGATAATLVGVCVLASLAIAVGSLLVIPGIVLWIWWSLAPVVVVREESSVVEALRRSRELIRGEGWSLFGLVFCIGIATTIAFFIVTRFDWAGPLSSPTPAAHGAMIAVQAALAPVVMLWLIRLYYDRTGDT